MIYRTRFSSKCSPQEKGPIGCFKGSHPFHSGSMLIHKGSEPVKPFLTMYLPYTFDAFNSHVQITSIYNGFPKYITPL
jgi:hypothetical protein